ncbi:Swi5-domain-containing protein [Kalaharituber pfeilii]|nr:Swi5-domain-containing protein [Kalaharituber pfeilii]
MGGSDMTPDLPIAAVGDANQEAGLEPNEAAASELSSPSAPSSGIVPSATSLSMGASKALNSSSKEPAEDETQIAPKTADDRRLESLKSQSADLEKQLEEVLAKQKGVNSMLKNPSNPEATVKRHISLLHQFNEIRDVAQGLLGLIAENRGVRVQDIYLEFGLDPDD